MKSTLSKQIQPPQTSKEIAAFSKLMGIVSKGRQAWVTLNRDNRVSCVKAMPGPITLSDCYTISIGGVRFKRYSKRAWIADLTRDEEAAR
jgi:hypothetical protein